MTNLLHISHTGREVAPGDLLRTDPERDQVLRVTAGILYARHDEDDTVLVPGDSITLLAGESRRVWNAGDETAWVVVSESALRLAA